MKIDLHKDLISKYGPTTTVRPVKDDSSAVKVRMRMLVDHIVDFDEPKQQVKFFSAMKMVWTDDFLAWNESAYAGINLLQMDVDQIWSPTVTVLTSNSADFLKLNHRRVDVSSEGLVTWLSPAVITSTCFFDVHLFPFDVQQCVFKFGPWASPHTMEDLDFFYEGNETTVNRYKKNGVWEILNETAKKKYCNYSSSDESYAEVHYYITFRRMSRVYVLGVIIPSVLLSMSTMLIFLLPPESGEKISFGITNLLAMVLFQETVQSAMPPTGSPMFANYICVMVIVACTSLIFEAFVLHMYNLGNVRDVPRWMLRLFIRNTKHLRSCLSGHAREPVIDTSQQNLSVAGHNDDKEVPELEQRHKPSKLPGRPRPDNAELWKLVALSVEKKAAVITLCVIVGNILFTAVNMIIRKSQERFDLVHGVEP